MFQLSCQSRKVHAVTVLAQALPLGRRRLLEVSVSDIKRHVHL
jgi:hypothetical protein